MMHHWVPAAPSPSQSVLVAATSSDSDSDDEEALHSSNSRYDNHTPPCTGRRRVLRLMGEIRGAKQVTLVLSVLPGEQLLSEDMSLPADR